MVKFIETVEFDKKEKRIKGVSKLWYFHITTKTYKLVVRQVKDNNYHTFSFYNVNSKGYVVVKPLDILLNNDFTFSETRDNNETPLKQLNLMGSFQPQGVYSILVDNQIISEIATQSIKEISYKEERELGKSYQIDSIYISVKSNNNNKKKSKFTIIIGDIYIKDQQLSKKSNSYSLQQSNITMKNEILQVQFIFQSSTRTFYICCAKNEIIQRIKFNIDYENLSHDFVDVDSSTLIPKLKCKPSFDFKKNLLNLFSSKKSKLPWIFLNVTDSTKLKLITTTKTENHISFHGMTVKSNVKLKPLFATDDINKVDGIQATEFKKTIIFNTIKKEFQQDLKNPPIDFDEYKSLKHTHKIQFLNFVFPDRPDNSDTIFITRKLDILISGNTETNNLRSTAGSQPYFQWFTIKKEVIRIEIQGNDWLDNKIPKRTFFLCFKNPHELNSINIIIKNFMNPEADQVQWLKLEESNFGNPLLQFNGNYVPLQKLKSDLENFIQNNDSQNLTKEQKDIIKSMKMILSQLQ